MSQFTHVNIYMYVHSAGGELCTIVKYKCMKYFMHVGRVHVRRSSTFVEITNMQKVLCVYHTLGLICNNLPNHNASHFIMLLQIVMNCIL